MKDITIGTKPIRQPDERSMAEALRITLLIFTLATPFFLYMGLSAGQVKEEYRLSKLVEHRRILLKEHERLLLTRDALLSPSVVDTTAREKLGMVEEDPQEWTVGTPPEPGKQGGGAEARPPAKKDQADTNGSPAPGLHSAARTSRPASAAPPGASRPEAKKAPAASAPQHAVPAAPKEKGRPEKVSPAVSGASVKAVPVAKPPGGPARPKTQGRRRP